MDLKEVGEKSKALQKATAAQDPPENIIRILNDLKTGIKADEDLLRSTKIGVIVNRSKQHPDTSVRRLASEIVKKWRDDVQKAKGSSPSGKKSPDGGSSPAPLQKAANGQTSKPTVPPAERNWKKDQVDINRTNQATRDNTISLLYNGLCYMSTVPPAEVLRVATAVEAAGFAKLGPETNTTYVTKMRSLFMNFKNKSNPTLRVRVVEGEISPSDLISMNTEDLKSEKRKEEDQQLMKANMKEAQMPVAERSISTSIECSNPKCKGKYSVAYTQAQTRSADEPMTTFCECQSCGKRWKFS